MFEKDTSDKFFISLAHYKHCILLFHFCKKNKSGYYMNTELRLNSIHLLKAHLQETLNYAEYHSNAFCTADVLEIILNHTTISTTLTSYQKT